MWKLFSASVTGQRNLDQGTAGDDACHCRVNDGILLAVVCDGAGSVSEGRAGADFTSRALIDELTNSILALHSHSAEPQVQPDFGDIVRAAIETVRAQLAEIAASRQIALAEFSCTLVGCMAAAQGGCFFHIGDGFAIQQNPAGDCIVSTPENGEYADETFFVTDEDWREHLRLTPLLANGRRSLIGLLSDGTAPFAVDRERRGFSRPFIEPITAYLAEVTEEIGSEALRNLLQSARAQQISSDDKTLLLAFESGA